MLTGQAPHVQYGVAGVACHVLAAQHQLRSLRARAARVLTDARSTVERGAPEAHLSWLAGKERDSSEMRADLTFGVENYADSTLAAFFTVLVAPLSLAFSFFGVNTTDVDGGARHSLFSLSEFGWFWGSITAATLVIAVLAFLVLTDRPHRLWQKVFES